MSEVRPGQFEVVLSDGLRIERLPVGLAAGHLWVSFVFSGIDFFAGEHDRDGRLAWERREVLHFDGPNGSAPFLGGGGGGGDTTQHRHYEFGASNLPWLRVTYLEEGQAVATETIDIA